MDPDHWSPAEKRIARRVFDAALERELREVKAQQKRLTKAVAMADDVPELVTELRDRAVRARALEVRIATIQRAPSELRALVDQAETIVRERLTNIRAAMLDGADLRAVFLRLFPGGIQFRPVRVGDRQVWRLEGAAAIGRVALSESDAWFNMGENPSPSDEGSQPGHGDRETANKIAALPDHPPPARPADAGWFNLDRDPNGI